jgi:hypothetical protein
MSIRITIAALAILIPCAGCAKQPGETASLRDRPESQVAGGPLKATGKWMDCTAYDPSRGNRCLGWSDPDDGPKPLHVRFADGNSADIPYGTKIDRPDFFLCYAANCDSDGSGEAGETVKQGSTRRATARTR